MKNIIIKAIVTYKQYAIMKTPQQTITNNHTPPPPAPGGGVNQRRWEGHSRQCGSEAKVSPDVIGCVIVQLDLH